jgi:hypothetical protein
MDAFILTSAPLVKSFFIVLSEFLAGDEPEL